MNDHYQRTTALGLVPTDIDNIACTAHEAVKAWARSQGDYTHEIWSNTSAEHKDSMRDGVLARLENPEESSGANHHRWLERKVEEGWTYGPVRDPALKQSPALVSYAELPVEYQRRNEIFIAVVKALDPRQYSD